MAAERPASATSAKSESPPAFIIAAARSTEPERETLNFVLDLSSLTCGADTKTLAQRLTCARRHLSLALTSATAAVTERQVGERPI